MNAEAGAERRRSRNEPGKQPRESDMPLHHKPQRGEPRLRVIFADGPIALGMPVGSTLADVADRVDHIARQHNGSLLSIDVRMAARRAAPTLAGTH